MPKEKIITQKRQTSPEEFLNTLLGLWLIAAPLAFSGTGFGTTVNSMVIGILLIGLSLPRGQINEKYGSWQPWIV